MGYLPTIVTSFYVVKIALEYRLVRTSSQSKVVLALIKGEGQKHPKLNSYCNLFIFITLVIIKLLEYKFIDIFTCKMICSHAKRLKLFKKKKSIYLYISLQVSLITNRVRSKTKIS